LFFFAQNNKKLLECPHNKEQIILLMEYFGVPVPSILKESIAVMKENMVKIGQARQNSTNSESEVATEDPDDPTVGPRFRSTNISSKTAGQCNKRSHTT